MAENVGGFRFEDEDLIAQAKKELSGVDYVRAKVDLKRPQAVLQVYQRMIRGKMFQTQVGIAYLYELQTYLKGQSEIDRRAIIPIPAEATVVLSESPKKVRECEEKIAEQKKWLSLSVIGIFVLMVMVVAMIVIASTRGSTTILNYENEVIDKYAAWEQELSAREKEVRDRERALGIEWTD